MDGATEVVTTAACVEVEEVDVDVVVGVGDVVDGIVDVVVVVDEDADEDLMRISQEFRGKAEEEKDVISYGSWGSNDGGKDFGRCGLNNSDWVGSRWGYNEGALYSRTFRISLMQKDVVGPSMIRIGRAKGEH